MESQHKNTNHEKIAEEKFKTLISNNFMKELELNVNLLAEKAVKNVINKREDTENNNSTINGNHKSKPITKKILSDKVFVPRDSLLTELLEVSHAKTIYNLFVAILIILFLNAIIHDLISYGRINLGTGLITIGFGKISIALSIWICMQFALLIPFSLLKKWASVRKKLNKSNTITCDVAWIIIGIIFQSGFLCIPIYFVVKNQLPIASALIVLIEDIRMMMKIYAFVRTVSPRFLESNNAPLPDFSNYLYFLFAPTLVYRDSYPRTNNVQWNKVMIQLFEVAGIIFYINFLCEKFLVHNFETFGKTSEVLEVKQLIIALFGSMLPALLTFVLCFYLLIHCWHNASAEMLKFADRRFYMDWWTQTGYGGFYRTWNMIVHDWLYTYIYKDMFKLSGNRILAAFSVFFISAVFHEIIIIFALGFFYPVLLILFGCFGVLLIFITKHASPVYGNTVMWLTLAIGNGILWWAYGLEFYARKNCPKIIESDMYDLIVPRSWFCHQIIFTPNWEFQNPFSATTS